MKERGNHEALGVLNAKPHPSLNLDRRNNSHRMPNSLEPKLSTLNLQAPLESMTQASASSWSNAPQTQRFDIVLDLSTLEDYPNAGVMQNLELSQNYEMHSF